MPVEMIKIEIEVPKEHHELAQAMVGMYAIAKKQLENGFQPMEDISAIVLASYAKLYEAVSGFENLIPEAKERPGALLKAYSNAIGDMVDAPK